MTDLAYYQQLGVALPGLVLPSIVLFGAAWLLGRWSDASYARRRLRLVVTAAFLCLPLAALAPAWQAPILLGWTAGLVLSMVLLGGFSSYPVGHRANAILGFNAFRGYTVGVCGVTIVAGYLWNGDDLLGAWPLRVMPYLVWASIGYIVVSTALIAFWDDTPAQARLLRFRRFEKEGTVTSHARFRHGFWPAGGRLQGGVMLAHALLFFAAVGTGVSGYEREPMPDWNKHTKPDTDKPQKGPEQNEDDGTWAEPDERDETGLRQSWELALAKYHRMAGVSGSVGLVAVALCLPFLWRRRSSELDDPPTGSRHKPSGRRLVLSPAHEELEHHFEFALLEWGTTHMALLESHLGVWFHGNVTIEFTTVASSWEERFEYRSETRTIVFRNRWDQASPARARAGLGDLHVALLTALNQDRPRGGRYDSEKRSAFGRFAKDVAAELGLNPIPERVPLGDTQGEDDRWSVYYVRARSVSLECTAALDDQGLTVSLRNRGPTRLRSNSARLVLDGVPEPVLVPAAAQPWSGTCAHRIPAEKLGAPRGKPRLLRAQVLQPEPPLEWTTIQEIRVGSAEEA